MIPDEKQLLLKDLCPRLRYGVLCDRLGQPRKLVGIENRFAGKYTIYLDNGDYMPIPYAIEDVKPYLRPMSSMTEEERKEILSIDYAQIHTGNCWSWTFANHKQIDWLNAHHFDYRGLIEKGLAMEAPEGMYKED